MARVIAVCVCAMLVLAGCGKSQPASSPSAPARVGIVTSIYPLADWARNVGGDHVDVRALLKPGSNPHTFEPTPDDSILVAQSKVLFCVGLNLEDWIGDIAAAGGKTSPRIVYLSDAIKPDEIVAGDPHVWVNPALAATMVGRMASVLGEVDPPHAADYARAGEAYAARLRKLGKWCVAQLAALPVHQVVIYHPAFGYLFRSAGIKVLGTIEESPGREASPEELAALITAMRKVGTKVVFVEPEFSEKLGRVVANEVGGRVVALDPIGDPSDPQRDTYIHLMEYNVARIVAALGGRPSQPPEF